ncbi:conjugal transfer protein [Listeria seeligeri]|uniref:conjugal transfer protein n=1 Tax=Listeria seeligeri TaxID=1640 RepID=UPI0010D4E288|nr:conjugal transfer protein [Listeria seeligeri]EAD3476090.1 conjugal transfer protein [Listeria monocytogenes]EAG4636596.1 conjugal transfer protein [Listeria monocytogenes]EAH4084466.1 conjugal transfer protein [Listeria monocytogenes]EEO9180094.1 conjugal transfer protein [Listeria monocytogenes]EIF6131963.1 conjugal transfer protein [Listeria monocytogenes]
MRIFNKLKTKLEHVEKQKKPKTIIEKDKRKQTIALTYAIFFCILFCSVGSLLLSLQTTGQSLQTSPEKQEKASSINYPAVQSFLNPFVDSYINVSDDSEKNEERQKTLQNSMVNSADYSNSFAVEGEGQRILQQKELYSVTETTNNTLLAQYKVTYINRTFVEKEVTKKSGKKVIKEKIKEPKDEQKTALLNIELVQKENAYAVNSLPYFTNLYTLKSTMDKEEKEEDLNNYDGQKEKEIMAFLNDFLEKYASSSSDDMAYMMKSPEGLGGSLTFDRIDKYELYQKSGNILADVHVVFLEPDTKINVEEDFTIILTKKDSHYYVEKLEHK